MDKAKQIYEMILIEVNGYSEKEVRELDDEIIKCDPIYEKIVNIISQRKE